MRRTLQHLLVAAALAIVPATLACSDDDTSNNNNTNNNNTNNNNNSNNNNSNNNNNVTDGGVSSGDGSSSVSLSFKSLTAYSAQKGTVNLEVTVVGTPTKVALMADGKEVATADKSPWTLSWDTTKSTDGLVKLEAQAYTAAGVAGKASTEVVVLNKGEVAKWKNGNSGAVDVTTLPYVDQHLRYQWDMPSGARAVISILTWTGSGFDLELAIGVGTCPHSGTTATQKHAKTSPVVVRYPASGGQSIPQAQWFAHVQLMNSTDKSLEGKKAPFKITTYILK